MKKGKKLTMLVVVILLIASLMAGCAPAASTPTTTAGTTAGEGADATTTTAAPADTSAETDAPAQPNRVVLYQSSWATPIEDPANQLVKAEIDKILNIDFTILVAPPENAEEQLNLLLSSDEQIDFVVGPMRDKFKGYRDGIVAPLNDLIDEYGANIMRMTPPELWPLVTASDGSIIEIPNVSLGDQNYLAVRQDLLDEFGMEKPKTLEEFETYLQKAKDHMGIAPLYAHLSTDGLWPELDSTLRALGGMFFKDGYNPVTYDESGNLISTRLTDEYKNAIMKLAEWYQEGYIPTDIFTWDQAKTDAAFAQGQIGARITWASTGFQPYAEGFLKDNPEAFYVYCTPMSGPVGNAGSQGIPYSGGDWINNKSKVKEDVMRFLDWIVADVENYMLAAYGVEGVHFEWTDKSTYTYRVLESDAPYGASLYTFDHHGVRIKAVNPPLYNQEGYKQFEAAGPHAQQVPKNPFAPSVFGAFSEVNAEFPVTDYDTFFEEQQTLFITGSRSFDEWDAFIAEYGAMVKDYDAARNTVWQEVKEGLGGW